MSVNSFRLLFDKLTHKPALSFDKYAAALASKIKKSEPQFAVGLFGSWRSAKTTLIHEIKRRLNINKAISVDFSAWRYAKDEHLIVPLLDTVHDVLVDWSNQQKIGAQSA